MLKDERNEARRILKLLYESKWLEDEHTIYWHEFDTDDRDLTEMALSELIKLTAEPEAVNGIQVGCTLIDGYSINGDNHCILYVKNTRPENILMAAFLKSVFMDVGK